MHTILHLSWVQMADFLSFDRWVQKLKTIHQATSVGKINSLLKLIPFCENQIGEQPASIRMSLIAFTGFSLPVFIYIYYHVWEVDQKKYRGTETTMKNTKMMLQIE